MAEPDDMIMPKLNKIRDEIRNLRVNTDRNFEVIRSELESLKDSYRSEKSAMVADTLLQKLVTGDFEQRIEALEAELKALKAGH